MGAWRRMVEKRASVRVPIKLEAKLTWSHATFETVVTELSENGLYLIAPPGGRHFALRDKESVEVSLRTPDGDILQLQCREIWADTTASEHSARKIGLEISSPPPAFGELYRNAYFKAKKETSHDAIAVIGMACHYPGAGDLKTFWENILARRREFRRFPDQRLPLAEYYDPDPYMPDKTYADRAALIDGFQFDWIKRGIPKAVVESSDIVHWLALDVALRALDDAGYTRQEIPRDRTGVILGNTLTGEHARSQYMRLRWPYVKKVLKTAAQHKRLPSDTIDDLVDTMEVYYKSAFAPITEDTLAGNLSNTIAGRICNYLDLHGGGYTVDGACSSSLIAVATAAGALSNGTLDVAIVGGVDISLDTFELVGFAKTNALTKADMKVYDRNASGFLPGEGAGIVVLKRLQTALAHNNYIYAVLKGWGISSDGKGGLTAPKPETQALAMRRAYGKAGYGLDEVDFIEGHGTGTVAGDKAELEGIADAMNGHEAASLRSCGITSLKSLIGHTKAASGIGGFIKAVMAVNRRCIPPTASCKEPNPVFEEKAQNVYPVIQGQQYEDDDLLKAGVSGMGFGGINCHVTIESAGEPARGLQPAIGERELMVSSQESELFMLTAQSQQKMLEELDRLRGMVDGISIGEMVDLSSHLADSNPADATFRLAMIAGSPDGLFDCINRSEQLLKSNEIPVGGYRSDPQRDVWAGNEGSARRIGFLFPGQGSQQLNMARVLRERYPWVREFGESADSWLHEGGFDQVVDSIYRPLDRALNKKQIDEWMQSLSQVEVAQPAICLASLLWMKRLDRLGIRPGIVGGHSLGELTAFHAAGAFNEKGLMVFSAFRGRATSARNDNVGIMASFACSQERTVSLLKQVDGYAVIANINSPEQTIVSGDRASVERAVQLALFSGIKTKYLPVANAFHSRFMKRAAEEIGQHAPIPEFFGTMVCRLFTCIDGTEIKPGADLRAHFARQVVSQVDFIALIRAMQKECDILVEVGPGRVLSDLVWGIQGGGGPLCLPVEARAGDDRSLNVLLAACYVHGMKIEWPELFANRLVRPFVPAGERLFIDNPCERPFRPDAAALLQSVLHIEAPFVDDTAVLSPEESNGLFSGQQIEYMRRLIRSELQGKGGDIVVQPEVQSSLPTAPPVPEVSNQPLTVTVRGPEFLIDLAAETTGFPKDAITLQHRLLDNLNLDSIKAAVFVGKAVKAFGASGSLDPSTMVNSSLQEIYDSIALLISSGDGDQLHEGGGSYASVVPQGANWVRDFRITYVKKPFLHRRSLDELTALLENEKKHVAIVSDGEADAASLAMKDILTANGVHALGTTYNGAIGAPAVLDPCDYLLFLLPAGKQDEAGLLSGKQLYEMAQRLHAISTIIASRKTHEPKASYAVLQFGSGILHACDPAASLTAKGASAYLCSVYLEIPGELIRVLEFPAAGDPSAILEAALQELRSEDELVVAGYDTAFERRVPVMEAVNWENAPRRTLRWTAKDVVLVTGGAKGITAECALAFAQKTGVQLALVGSTVDIGADEEIQNTLQRYRQSGIVHAYYACDISDRCGFEQVYKRIKKELGAITGVIHGAGLNRPRRADQVVLEQALQEIGPKLLGALNICEALRKKPPKLFVGLGSVIGITGMAGNAWYGFSNEMLNLVLQRFARITRKTEVITCAFSIWDEVGMGVRMGSLAFLSRLGILPIPREQGVEHFMRLVEYRAPDDQIVVTSRMGTLGIMRHPMPERGHRRFLEEILFFEQGVETDIRALLTLDKDPYLKDHLFRGMYLFPAVFGIEAMAQAATMVAGISDMSQFTIENIQLSRPIVVDRGGATEIRIRALVEEPRGAEEETRVTVGIGVDQTRFSSNHFEATFIFGKQRETATYDGELPQTALEIIPEEDLYGGILFQGKVFQRIRAIRSLNSARCIFESERNPGYDPFSGFLGATGAGDPFFRDTLLQSIQIVLPDAVALPVGIARLDVWPASSEQSVCTVITELVERTETDVTANVMVIDKNGKIIEQLQKYKVKFIEMIPNAFRAEDLVDPDDWDEKRIRNIIEQIFAKLKQPAPVVTLKHNNTMHDMVRDLRHVVQRDLLQRAYHRLRQMDATWPKDISVEWSEEGKPLAIGAVDIGLSCSHDARLCMCVAGKGGQGCDVEILTARSEAEWLSLLGDSRVGLLHAVSAKDVSIDSAGSRIWCALEALRKATNMQAGELSVEKWIDDYLVLHGGGLFIVTFSMKLLRGRERMMAFAFSHMNGDGPESADVLIHKESPDVDMWAGQRVEGDGPQGQDVFSYRFPLILQDSAGVGGGIYFAKYFEWLGKVREIGLKPIGSYIAEEFTSGHFMVTNYSSTEIIGQIANDQTVDARMWIHNLFGQNNSALSLYFEWRKLMNSGVILPVAFTRHEVSWIKVIGHGIVEPVPCPPYFMEFLRDGRLPQGKSEGAGHSFSDGLNRSGVDLGNVILEGNILREDNILAESMIDTTLQHSNLAQNIYFSNYFIWQGQVRDRYLYSLSPEFYRAMDLNGRLACIRCDVKHLREGMPFDRIVVTMRLKRLYERGLELHFEYFKQGNGDEKIKLAYGTHAMAWVSVDALGMYQSHELPAPYRDKLLGRSR